MIIELAERGHDEDRLWNSTPRELAGRLSFSEKRRKRETAQQLATNATAARGNPKDIKKQLKEAEKD